MRSLKQSAKLAMLLLLALLLLLLCNGVVNIHCKTIHESSVDLHALLDFKKGITNDAPALSNWNTTTHVCRWTGVNCTTTPPFHVRSLNLTGQNLQGQITPSLGNLTFLGDLYLDTNLLQGNIPDALTNCSRLETLFLSSNMLVGSIPRNIGFLSNLLDVDLSRNNLTGNIPPSFKNITHLEKISLVDNQLEGSIPEALGQLPEIQQILLGGNGLFGRIPTTFLNLTVLQILDLSINMLSGILPSNFGLMLPKLNYLILDDNKFEGGIPPSLGNASQLQNVDLSYNSFTGQIPSYWGKLNYLYYLNLGQNELEARDSQSWEFLSALSTCPLQTLSLYGNQLHGVLPNSIGNLSIMLEQLDLGANSLFGTVPPSIGKYHNLFSLTLSYNNLTGTIENWIRTLKNLEGLDLEENNFTGPIPYSIGNLTKLVSLSLSKNRFDGVMPSTLGNFPQLTQLDLSNNNIQGSIPSQISNLNQLTELHLSSNKLTGEIPKSLGQCDHLVTIEIDQNMILGEIPTSFGNLKALNMLNLSHNNLSGTIPALIDLELLSKLDLSHNHLHGEIPRYGVFRNSTSVYLEGNWGLCGGVVDLQMPLCPSVARRSEREYYLVRTLVPILGFISLIILTYIIFLGKNTSRRTYMLFHSFGKNFPRVSYNDLNRATGNFSEAKLLGRGSYGSVYRGELTQAKIQVAIKVFDVDMKCVDRSFLTECEILRSIRHRNLLPILTACSTIDNNGDDFRALIFEFMPNGNLDTWLHEKFAGDSCLSLAQRATIAVGIADALAYLHHDCEMQIVHCDLKPTNILLDDDMNAYLGDFGIASLVGHSSSNTSIGLKGTIGYIAPEYAQSGQVSISGDVYSFGIVLLEMLIGKRPTDPMFGNEFSLVNFVERNYPDQILHIIDARLQRECESYIEANITMKNAVYGCLLSLIQVSLSCTCLIPRERMNIREVTTKLHSIRTSCIRATEREQVLLH